MEDEKTVRVSAPGKVILHGEHSVVYGKRALALSLDLRTTLTLSPSSDTVSIILPDVGITESWPLQKVEQLWRQLGHHQNKEPLTPAPLSKDDAIIFRKFLGLKPGHEGKKQLALLSFFYLYMSILPQPRPLVISVKSQMPTGAGLGSSAAYVVCISGALLRYSGEIDEENLILSEAGKSSPGRKEALDKVCQWAFFSEQIVHGTCSGIDNSICTYGESVSFKNGTPEPLHLPSLNILLVNTGVPRNTRELVAGVKIRRESIPAVIDPILNSMDALSELALVVLKELFEAQNSTQNDDSAITAAYKKLNELIDVNQSLLCALGVSHPALDNLVSVAQSYGLHAKLTGAGGGGFGVVIVGNQVPESDVNLCRQKLENSGYDVWTTKLGVPGLVLHPNH